MPVSQRRTTGRIRRRSSSPCRTTPRIAGFEIVDSYVDVGISGAKDRRPQLDRLMSDARKRRFDALLVLRFDRFARSTKHLVLALEEFSSLGIDFISLNESIDTSSAIGRMVFTVIAAVPELEPPSLGARAGRCGPRTQSRQAVRPAPRRLRPGKGSG